MSLMSGLYVGTSGLQTSQNALNTTAHNLSNIDTTGYTRQQVVQSDKDYNKVGTAYISSQQTGLGVNYAKVRQVRDYFLDKTYRTENGRSSYYEKAYDISGEIETLLGEMEGVEFQEGLTDLWSAVQELQKDPSNATNQGMLVSKATTFLERAQAVYNGMSDYQDLLNTEIADTVDIINDYGNQIRELNQKIVAAEAGNTEEANDLRDARNQLIDELSGYVRVTSADEDAYGAVTVQIEYKDFVTTGYVNELEAQQDDETGFYTVVWSNDSDLNGNKIPLYDISKEISSETNTDIGSLKSLIIMRGEDRGKYTDIPEEPVEEDFSGGTKSEYFTYERALQWYKDENGAFTAKPEETDYPKYVDITYDQAVAGYNSDVTVYNNTVNKSLLQNTMAEFDRLVNGIATGLNEILNPTNEAGDAKTGYNLFLRTNVDENATTDLDPEEKMEEPITLWTTSNLKINSLLLQNYSYLGALTYDDGATYTKGFMTDDGQENREMADALTALFSDSFATLNPNTSTAANFVTYYDNMVGDIAITGNVYKNMAENEEAAASSIDDSRQQIMGVNDSEELTNMIMYQNAYNASSRYISTLNDMLGTLIQSMGV